LEILSSEFVPLIWRSIKDFRRVFLNIFSLEFNYLRQFFTGKTSFEPIFSFLHNSLIFISVVILIYTLVFVVRRIGKEIFERKIKASSWMFYFFLLMLLAELGKIFLLQPSRLVESRHHLDLVFLLIISFLVFITNVLKINKSWSFKSLISIALLVILSLPHLYYYYLQTDFKQHSYQTIIKCLAEHKIKYLTTDFIIAYPLYERWHINLTAKKRKETINSLRSARIPYKIINLNKYWLIVPKKHLP